MKLGRSQWVTFISMNLKGNFRKYKIIIFILPLLILLTIVLTNERTLRKPKWDLEEKNEAVMGAIEEVLDNREARKVKDIEHEEFSPNQLKKVVVYKMTFDPELYNDYYEDYFYNRKIIAVRDIKSRREEYIFTGEERTGDPHWLGNNYVFFTTYCGTACRGLYLVDTRNKETWLAVLDHTFSYKKDVYDTHFKDWFGQEFVSEGLIDEIKSEMVDDKAYLIFKMKNNQGDFTYEKRFLFTGGELKEVVPKR